MIKQKTIIINFNDLNSINLAEKVKTKLENDGFNLEKTIQLKLNEFELIYIKNE